MSNSIGKTAIIVFSSFVTLNWAINTIQSCISNAHAIVLARDKENHRKINSSAMIIELISSIVIAILIFIFSKQITYVCNLENDAREILVIILKLKTIQLPLLAIGYVPKNILKINNKTNNLLKKVDIVGLYGNIFAIAFIPIFIYPLWLLLGKSIPWNNCNPYIWIYSTEFVATVAGCNYRAYLSANKNTKAIRMMAFIGGILVRVPLCYLIQKYNIGLIGLSFVCGIDRIVRAIYLRLYIMLNKEKLYI